MAFDLWTQPPALSCAAATLGASAGKGPRPSPQVPEWKNQHGSQWASAHAISAPGAAGELYCVGAAARWGCPPSHPDGWNNW